MKPIYLVVPFVLLITAWVIIPKDTSNNLFEHEDDLSRSIQDAALPEMMTNKALVSTHVKPTGMPNTQLVAEEAAISSIEQIRNMTEQSALHLALLEDYDQYKRYPSENRRIESPAQDPITQRYAVDERTTANENHVGMTIWSDKKFYLRDQAAKVNGYLVDESGDKQATTFQADILFNQIKLGSIVLTDEDRDQVYSYSLPLMEGDIVFEQAGIYKVVVRNDEHNLVDAITFTVSEPDISLTGEYRDRITADGNLIIEAEVLVSASAKFYVQASLYSSTHVPVGVTQVSMALSTGRHWIPLSFSGVMIQDAQESGPYVLKQLSLAKVTMPMQRAPLEEPGYQTEAYALDEFSGTSNQDQNVLK